MPMLDVRVALTNPYTLDAFTVIRRAENVNNFGESTASGTTFPNVKGIVTPASEEDLERGIDYEIQAKSITIKTRFLLRGSSKDGIPQSYQPDIIIWHGNQYIVKPVFDWSAYASGFVKAICEIYDLVAHPPPGV